MLVIVVMKTTHPIQEGAVATALQISLTVVIAVLPVTTRVEVRLPPMYPETYDRTLNPEPQGNTRSLYLVNNIINMK